MEKKILTTVVTSTGEKKVKRSALVEIEDRDIATIEALRYILLDSHGYSLNFPPMKNAGELIIKMYEAFE
ncbi:MAG: hypothetical protein ABIG69_02965 [Bacteroidota bacterium]